MMPPSCPLCKGPLRRVVNTGGWVNDEEFESQKAGDWYCLCRNNNRSATPYAYFWDDEVVHQEEVPTERITKDNFNPTLILQQLDGKEGVTEEEAKRLLEESCYAFIHLQHEYQNLILKIRAALPSE